ncbi:MAG: hypothetical protein AAF927_14880 [Bacteroidota bacterium]
MSILLSFLLVFHPNWDVDPDLWGIGLLNLRKTIDSPNTNFNLPPDIKINFYDAPEGEVQGYLVRQAVGGHASWKDIEVVPRFAERLTLHQHDSREVNYHISSLLVFERRKEWVKVLHHTLAGEQWIKLDELAPHNIYYQDWIDFLVDMPTTYHPPSAFGLNLRSGAGVPFGLLCTMKGDGFQIELSGKKAHGQWLEAKVTEYSEHPCVDGKPTGNVWTGWFKAIDDKGFPNVWFYTRGC